MSLAVPFVQAMRRLSTTYERSEVIRSLVYVKDPVEATIALKILKEVYKPSDASTLTGESLMDNVFKHPSAFRTWVHLIVDKGVFPKARDVASRLYFSAMPPERRVAYDAMLTDALHRQYARNHPWTQELATFRSMAANRNAPCGPTRVFIVDHRIPERQSKYTINGKVVPVHIVHKAPAFAEEKIRTGAIQMCQYVSGIASTILGNQAGYSMHVGVLVVDQRTGAILAAATCRRKPHTFFIDYLCSARQCKGAGSILMQAVEKYAANLGVMRVRLESSSNAEAFYKKIGFNSNSNNEGYKVKYLFAPAKRTKRQRSPNANRKSPNIPNRGSPPPKRATPASTNSNSSRK